MIIKTSCAKTSKFMTDGPPKFGGDWTVMYSRISHFVMLFKTSARRPVITTIFLHQTISIIYNLTVNTAYKSSLAKEHQSSNQGQRTNSAQSCDNGMVAITDAALPHCTSIAIFWIKDWRALLSPVWSMIREPICRTNERALDPQESRHREGKNERRWLSWNIS